MGTGELNAGDNPEIDWHPTQSLHATETEDKGWPDGPLRPNADFTIHFVFIDVITMLYKPWYLDHRVLVLLFLHLPVACSKLCKPWRIHVPSYHR